MKKQAILLFLLLTAIASQAARVDTMRVYSASMKKRVEVVVIVPEKADALTASVYLLHGHGGNARTWLGMRPDLKEMADQHNLLFICPDGKNSWFWDSPVVASSRYETFVAKELVAYVQTRYKVNDRSDKRAISGLSMGGHGALWLAMRHPQVFGLAGSMSGGLDIRPFPNNWNMKDYLGAKNQHPERWKNYSVRGQLEKLQKGQLHIIIDCGVDDFFFKVNEEVHHALLNRGIEHDYIVRPGGHNAAYWKNALDYHLLFFLKHFER